MTQALLLVGHGSRDADGVGEFLEFVDRVKAAAGERLVEHCFIELAEPDIPTGIAACVQKGADQVAVLPITLLAANHAKLEVPEYLDAARQQYPGVAFHYGRPLAIDPLLLSILRERFAETEAAHGPFDRAETAVILVGRGSSDPDANSDVAKIARIFLEQEGVALVDICYTGVTYPDLPTVMRRLARLGVGRVVVLPYFLFTGVLVRRIEGWVRQMQAEFPAIPIHLGRYFGDHPKLLTLIFAREQEALAGTAQMNCDHCRFRLLAPEEHHHHARD